MSSRTARILAFALAVLPVFAAAQAPPVPSATAPSPSAAVTAPDTVLIRNASITLTRAEYDLELTRLPPDARGGFGADPARVNGLLNRMLVTKTMAAQARAAGIDKRPEVQQRIALEVERVLAALYADEISAEAAAEFNARPGVEAAARERWVADADRYRTPERVSVTHVLFDVSKRGKDDALRLAQETRAKVLAGADMNALAREISDDPSARRNAGRIEDFTRESMDPAFSRAAFALEKPGDLSEPVLSQFGYHVIRLDGRQPSTLPSFAETRDAIIAEMRNRYVEQRRGEHVMAIRNDPHIVVNEPAVEALVIRVDQAELSKMLERSKAEKQTSDPAPAADHPAPK